MLHLTPAERRGALTVALILIVGAGYDLVRSRVSAPAPPRAAASAPADTMPRAAAIEDTVAPVAAATLRVAAPAGTPVDINRASAPELDALPGIGPVLAGRIVEHRATHGPFRSTDELLLVRGIGPALYARLAPRVTAGSAAPRRP